MTYRSDKAAECFLFVNEFRRRIKTNVLFPMVPDSIVHPLEELLRQAEQKLVLVLYENNAIEMVTKINQTLDLDLKK